MADGPRIFVHICVPEVSVDYARNMMVAHTKKYHWILVMVQAKSPLNKL